MPTAADNTDPSPVAASDRTAWRRWMLLGSAGVLALVAYSSTWSGLMSRWSVDGGYLHGWLLLAAVAWILFSRGPGWVGNAGAPSAWGAVLTLVAGLGWLASRIMSVAATEQIFALLVAASVPLGILGFRQGAHVALAVLVLGFAVPIWDLFGPVLQQLTTDIVGFCLGTTSVPVLIEGHLVTIPSGQFRIVAGCSGLNYFVAGGAMAAVMGYLWLERWRDRIVLLAAAFALALVGNWVRVYTVILAGHLTDMQHYLVQVDHYYFGWILFGIAMIPIYWLAARMEGDHTRTERPSSDAKRRASEGLLVPLAVLLAVAFAPALWALVPAQGEILTRESQAAPDIPGWQRIGDSRDWRPHFSNADELLVSRYGNGGQSVELAVAWYATQEQGRELIYYKNRVADPRTWRTIDESTAVVGDKEYRSSTIADRYGNTRRVLYWYEVGGMTALSDASAKVMQLVAFAQGRRDGAAVMVAAPCEPDCDAAAAQMGEFLAGLDRPLLR